MASRAPQRLASQPTTQPQASTPNMSSEATAPGQGRRSSVAQSTTSEDSQTVLLNRPPSTRSSPDPEVRSLQNTSRPKAHSTQSTKEPRKCWICFGDETEDSPTSSQWRSPCPCALTAHEACLLDWVADVESPSKRKGSRPKIQCPQCKATITVNRPRSPVVEAVRAVERVTGKLLIPAVGLTLAGTAFAGCWMHGLSSVFLIFGSEDAEHLLGLDGTAGTSSSWGITLVLIPMALIAARTRYADNLFPVIPIFYFASTATRREGPLWPPSVTFTIASLPYLRAIYNEFYNRVYVTYEKAWSKAIQPRGGEDENDEEQVQDENNEGAENGLPGGMNFELDLQVELVDEGEEEAADEQQQPAEQPAGNAAAGVQAQAGEGLPQNPIPDPPHPDNRPPQAANQGMIGAGNVVVWTLAAAQMSMGALLFPTVSAAMGGLLQVALPKTWTTPPGRWDRYPPGFLQSRFGRSVAGGCLFIALKDTILLYAKYRLAQDHKRRRVVDYVPKKNKEDPSS